MSDPKITYGQLIAYAAGEVSPEEAAETEAYLVRNAEAAATVARFRLAHATMQADDGVDPRAEIGARAQRIFSPRADERPPRWWEQLERMVATLIYDSRPQPVLAGYRGSESGFQLSYESEPVKVDVQVDPVEGWGDAAAERRTWHLMGQIDTQQPQQGSWVALIRHGTSDPAAEWVVDEHGFFGFEAEPGLYDLVIRHGGSVVVLPNIEIA